MDVLTAVLALGVAAGYFTIAGLIVPRIHLEEARPRFVAAFRVGGIAFFVGCGLTHTHIAYHALVDDRGAGAHEAGFHLLQVFGVWVFIYAALRFVEVRVVRRKTRGEVEAERLRARVEALSRSNRDLEHFAQVVAHDLQDPLRSITGFAELVEQRAGARIEAEDVRSLRHIRDGSARMSHLLDGILAYSRVAAAELAREPVDLDEVLRDATAGLRHLIEQRGALITADPLPVVEGDPVQLAQLVQNLLANAVKFGDPDTPRVHVSASESDGMPEISVRDNGSGIAPRDAERVFAMFQRGSASAGQPGTGVGLALCAKIAGRHGGRLWHEPAEGGGTVFRFTLLAPGVTTDASRVPAAAAAR